MTLTICTHKGAIQQIAFACGYLVFDNRGRPIEVKPFSTDTPQEIQSSSIFDPIKVEKKESVTGLNINVHSFVLKAEQEQVFKGFLKKGKREILFSSPCQNLEVTSQNIKITESGINYAVLEVQKDAEYSITGQKYEDKS